MTVTRERGANVNEPVDESDNLPRDNAAARIVCLLPKRAPATETSSSAMRFRGNTCVAITATRSLHTATNHDVLNSIRIRIRRRLLGSMTHTLYGELRRLRFRGD